MTLMETSMVPTFSVTSRACSSTARSSRALSSATSADPPSAAILLGDRLERLPGAPGEEDARALPGEGPGNATAYPSASAVDDGVLTFEQQFHSLLSVDRKSVV